LLSDSDKSVSIAYGAAADDSAGYSSRISYLIGTDGKVAKAYAKVTPAEHPDEVLADLA
jgi:peroxiredoxin